MSKKDDTGAIESKLPAHPPKKTGKRGIGPTPDPVAEPKEVESQPKVKERGTSLLVEQPKKPKVVKERFEVFFLKAVPSKNHKGILLMGLRLTTPVEKEHMDVLPKMIRRAYENSGQRGWAGEKLRDVPAHAIDFYLTHDMKEPVLEIKAAQLLGVRLDLVQRKGEGESRKVVRLTMMVQAKQSREIGAFAINNHSNSFWIEMHEVEPELLGLDEGNEDQ